MESTVELAYAEEAAPDLNVDLTFQALEKVEGTLRVPVVEVQRGAGLDLLTCIAGGRTDRSVKVRPLAYLQVDGDLQVLPIVDRRKILLASVAFVMWIGLWVGLVWGQWRRLHGVRGADATQSA